MNKFIVELRVFRDHKFQWVAIHPTGGAAYTMESKREAEEFIDKWYPDVIINKEIRITEVL